MRGSLLMCVALALCASERGYAAPSLLDGSYYCSMQVDPRVGGTMGVGIVEIRGQTYRGPSNAPSGAFAPFSVSEDGLIQWRNGFGEFSRGDNRLTVSTIAVPKNFFVGYISRYPHQLECAKN